MAFVRLLFQIKTYHHRVHVVGNIEWIEFLHEFMLVKVLKVVILDWVSHKTSALLATPSPSRSGTKNHIFLMFFKHFGQIFFIGFFFVRIGHTTRITVTDRGVV